ncbi:MAG TPA: hypothetical protein VLL95_01610 [Phnomibacter sp.]|nr:hypothetical protein [Phnomibacter sp.]
MKYYFPFCLFLLFSIVARSQLTKGTWIAGGAASFYSTQNKYASNIANQTSDVLRLSINPSIGYFLADKFAIGLRPNYTKNKAQVTSTSGLATNENRFDIGPFARYYFLQAEKQFNLLADISYQYGVYWFKPTKGNRNTFSASAGTVVFFNSSVGLELLLGYYTQKETINDAVKTINEQKGLQMTIGFQFHLEN